MNNFSKDFKAYKISNHDDVVDALVFAIQSLHRRQTLWQKIKRWFSKLKKKLKRKILQLLD